MGKTPYNFAPDRKLCNGQEGNQLHNGAFGAKIRSPPQSLFLVPVKSRVVPFPQPHANCCWEEGMMMQAMRRTDRSQALPYPMQVLALPFPEVRQTHRKASLHQPIFLKLWSRKPQHIPRKPCCAPSLPSGPPRNVCGEQPVCGSVPVSRKPGMPSAESHQKTMTYITAWNGHPS